MAPDPKPAPLNIKNGAKFLLGFILFTLTVGLLVRPYIALKRFVDWIGERLPEDGR